MNTTSGIKHSISPQTGIVSYSLGLSISGSGCEFGWSGTLGKLGVNLISGSIYDSNARFVGTYNSGSLISFSGNASSSQYDLYINGLGVSLNQAKSAHNYNCFYINPTGSANFNLLLYGIKPTILSTTGFNAITGQRITGNIYNTAGAVFRIYSGVISGTSTWSLSGIPTTNITGTGTYILVNPNSNSGVSIIPLKFYTDFGIYGVSVAVTGQIPSPYSMSLTPASGQIVSGTTGRYTGLFTLPTNTAVDVYLDMIAGSGTGGWNLYTGANPTTLYNFKSSGWFTSGGFHHTGISGVHISQNIFCNVFWSGYSGDVAKLVISGQNTGVYRLITGYV